MRSFKIKRKKKNYKKSKKIKLIGGKLNDVNFEKAKYLYVFLIIFGYTKKNSIAKKEFKNLLITSKHIPKSKVLNPLFKGHKDNHNYKGLSFWDTSFWKDIPPQMYTAKQMENVQL